MITVPPVLSFVAKQIVSGISQEQFNANATLNTEIMKDAIAETMPGVLPSNIKNFNVSSEYARRLSDESAGRVLSVSSIVLNYNVIVTANKTAEQLQDLLVDSINQGAFTSNLQTMATERGATNLQGASSDSNMPGGCFISARLPRFVRSA